MLHQNCIRADLSTERHQAIYVLGLLQIPPAPSSLSLPVFIKIRATSLLSLTSVA